MYYDFFIDCGKINKNKSYSTITEGHICHGNEGKDWGKVGRTF